jgi:hypothetical protein
MAAAQQQRYTGQMKLLRAYLIALTCAIPALALAQWQWIDKDGRKVFSDQMPPADIPAKNILRQPGQRGTASVEVPAAAEAAPAARPAASAPKLSGKDAELDARKKQAEAADAAKKQAKEEEAAAQRADNCVRAKSTKASLDAGVRIARFNAKGEREILDDAARAAETKRTDSIIASECKPAGG